MPLMQRYLKYKKENPDKFKEMKSFKIFTQMFGAGAYVLMWEYDSLADFEKVFTRMSKDEEWMKLNQEMMLLIDPATLSANLWNAVM